MDIRYTLPFRQSRCIDRPPDKFRRRAEGLVSGLEQGVDVGGEGGGVAAVDVAAAARTEPGDETTSSDHSTEFVERRMGCMG